jgi:hypothetical protein
MADEDLRSDAASSRGSRRGEASVHADHASEIGSVARQGQHRQAAETVPDGRAGLGDIRQGLQRRQPGPSAPQEQIRVVAHRRERGHYSLTIARNARAEHVAGQDNETERCVALSLGTSMIVQARAAVHQQQTRRRLPGDPVRANQESGQRNVAIRIAGLVSNDLHG